MVTIELQKCLTEDEICMYLSDFFIGKEKELVEFHILNCQNCKTKAKKIEREHNQSMERIRLISIVKALIYSWKTWEPDNYSHFFSDVSQDTFLKKRSIKGEIEGGSIYWIITKNDNIVSFFLASRELKLRGLIITLKAGDSISRELRLVNIRKDNSDEEIWDEVIFSGEEIGLLSQNIKQWEIALGDVKLEYQEKTKFIVLQKTFQACFSNWINKNLNLSQEKGEITEGGMDNDRIKWFFQKEKDYWRFVFITSEMGLVGKNFRLGIRETMKNFCFPLVRSLKSIFNIDFKYEENLNKTDVNEEIKVIFSLKGYPLSSIVRLNAKQIGREWELKDEENEKEYVIVKYEEDLEVYISQLRAEVIIDIKEEESLTLKNRSQEIYSKTM